MFNNHDLPRQEFDIPYPGLVSAINRSRRIFCGTLNQKFFLEEFFDLKKILLEDLCAANKNVNLVQRSSWIDSLDDRLKLCHLAAQSDVAWDWPAIIYLDHDRIRWATGKSRLLASGLCFDRPWHHLPVLILCSQNTVDLSLFDCVEIHDDKQLWSFLDLDRRRPYNFHAVMAVSVDDADGCVNMSLMNKHSSDRGLGSSRLQSFRPWADQYLHQNPKLDIYTDWPDQIHDTKHIWNVAIKGGSPWIDPDRPGMIDHDLHMHRWSGSADHALYVASPAEIDLSELIIWMDDSTGKYIDRNFRFGLVAKRGRQQTKWISTSRRHCPL